MAPLATGAHEIEQAVEQAAHVCGPRPPAGLSWRNERFDQAILVIAQSLARSKVADPSAIRGRPHCGLQTGKGSGGTLSTALVARQTNQHTLSKRALSSTLHLSWRCERQALIQKKSPVATKLSASSSGMISGPKSPGVVQPVPRHHRTWTPLSSPVGRKRAT